jgi:hypothetical protein
LALFFLPERFFAAGRFLAAEPFFFPFAAFFFAGLAGFRFAGAFRNAGGLVGGTLAADPAAGSAYDTLGASAKSSGGGELTPSSCMTVRPF